MFTHIMVGTDNVPAAKTFYDAVMGALGHDEGAIMGDDHGVGYATPTGYFAAVKPRNGEAPTFANGGTIGLFAADPKMVDAAHAAGLAAGGMDEGAPGPREMFPGAYGAYLRDPTGNKICIWQPPQA